MTEPINSILDSTKKTLGLDAGYDVFDTDIITHINSVFFTLNQLGLGPSEGFAIEGSSDTWDTFLGTSKILLAVKSYMYLRVRLLFDPPSTSFAITSMKEQALEYEWRLNVMAESMERPPTVSPSPSPSVPSSVIDGGADG